MFAKAISRYVRVTPRKARLAADLIRGLPVIEAKAQLSAYYSKGSQVIIKTLDSAVANAESLHNSKKDQLSVVEIRVDEGPRLKRSKGKARGGRVPIIKKTSHISIVVG